MFGLRDNDHWPASGPMGQRLWYGYGWLLIQHGENGVCLAIIIIYPVKLMESCGDSTQNLHLRLISSDWSIILVYNTSYSVDGGYNNNTPRSAMHFQTTHLSHTLTHSLTPAE